MSASTIDVKDAAGYILSKFDRPISTMKLQKLLYFAQGWTLALLERKLVATDFQAWKWGPVSYDLYRLHRREYEIAKIPGAETSNVSGNNRVIIDAVIGNYGGLSGMQLGDLTHEPDTPWTKARQNEKIFSETAPSKVIIPDKMIGDYFKKEFAQAQ